MCGSICRDPSIPDAFDENMWKLGGAVALQEWKAECRHSMIHHRRGWTVPQGIQILRFGVVGREMVQTKSLDVLKGDNSSTTTVMSTWEIGIGVYANPRSSWGRSGNGDYSWTPWGHTFIPVSHTIPL